MEECSIIVLDTEGWLINKKLFKKYNGLETMREEWEECICQTIRWFLINCKGICFK